MSNPASPVDTVAEVTARIIQRSSARRQTFLDTMLRDDRPRRTHLPCSNLAHDCAAATPDDKELIKNDQAAVIAMISAYNDLLSAHQPLGAMPPQIKQACREQQAVAQFAAGVPAMCDGITQGMAGMELSLFSREVIAQATAIGLCHDLFDGVLLLGVCDKIVPGLFLGAAAFAHLPAIFMAGGPMPTGISNREKARVRQLYAEGKVGRDELMASEMRSYHAPGTCTFYGTANTNQLVLEAMGLMLPGAAFVPPYTPLRDALTTAAARQACANSLRGATPKPLGTMVDERVFVNAMVALLATGGSTNHTIHLVAMAQALGITLTWEDFDALSRVTPLLARVYPNGEADVNRFHAAGGIAFCLHELLKARLLHADVTTVVGENLVDYTREPIMGERGLTWRDGPTSSADPTVLRPAGNPFEAEGGLRLLTGNLGRAVIKTSAVAPEHRRIEAPCRIFETQEAMQAAFRDGQLNADVVVVVRHQGPRANGMPELHKLTPALGVLQDRGFRVALVTDGRMSGASGKVPAAIHLTPEAAAGGPLCRLQDGDVITMDCERGVLEVRVATEELMRRTAALPPPGDTTLGRGLFAMYRANCTPADQGAVAYRGG